MKDNDTTVGELLSKNRFSKKVIYRIDTGLFGWKNYTYVGRDKYGQILLERSAKEELEALNLFPENARVIVIKL